MAGIGDRKRRLRIIQRTLVPFYIITVIFLLPTTMFCAATSVAGQCIPTRLGA